MANLPPKDISPSELFVKLTSRKRPHRIVDLPRTDPETGEPSGQVAMVPLTQGEMIVAAAEAEKKARKLLAGDLPKRDDAQLGYNDVYNNSAAAEILFRACKDPSDETLTKGAFKTPHEIVSAFSSDEIGVLYQDYEIVKQEVGPIIATMTDDEVEAWVGVLNEGGSGIPLGRLSWGALTTLVLSMASLIQTLRTDSSSPGSPVELPGSTESEATPE